MIIAILYLESPVVLIHGIGIGQIDVLGVLFFLLSIRFWLEKKYYKMASTMVYVCVADASFDGRGVHKEEEFTFYYIGNSLGFTLYSLAKFNTNEVNAMLVWNSLLGSRISGKHTYVSAWILERFSEYSTSIGYTIFMASFAILIGLFL